MPQTFSPPIASSERPLKAKVPSKTVFESIFPDDIKYKRPFSATINRPIDFVSEKLRVLENYPIFFENLKKVETIGEKKSKWFFKSEEELMAPMQLIKESSNHFLVWKTEDAAGFDFTFAVSVEEAQANRGTIVRIMSIYDSKTSDILSKLEAVLGTNASITMKKALQRFKAFCETGHFPTVEGQPSGRDKDSVILSPQPENQTLTH